MVIRLLILLLLATSLWGCRQNSTEEMFEFTTRPLKVEPGQTSMAGSEERRWIRVSERSELIWITGYEVTVLDDQGQTEKPLEFLCHASLDVTSDLYSQSVAAPVQQSGRLFTLSQGVTKVRFPEGFALPFHTRYPIALQSQVLNLNDRAEQTVKHRIRISYLRDKGLKKRPKALFLVRAPVLKSENPNGASFGEAIGQSACAAGENANPTGYIEKDSEGEVFFSHWKLPPGRDKSKALITDRLALERKVTCHYIVSHLHPTGESLELIDLTSVETLFRCQVESSENGLGINNLPIYSSAQGFSLDPGHEYGVMSVYNNNTDRTLDAMAVMYLYLHDPTYQPPHELEVDLPLPPGAKLVERSEQRVVYSLPLQKELTRAYYEDALSSDWQREDSGWKHTQGKIKLEQGNELGVTVLQLTLTN